MERAKQKWVKTNSFSKRMSSVIIALMLVINLFVGMGNVYGADGSFEQSADTQKQVYQIADTYPEWSANNTSYAVGNLVYYQGKIYECTYAHSSNEAWTPTAAVTLWKERSDLHGEPGNNQTETTKGSEQSTTKYEYIGSPQDGLASTLLIGYYHTWDNAGNPFLKLRDVDSNWDVINISFSEPVSPGSSDGRMKFEISGLSSSYTKADFKADVKTLQAQGKKIVLSIGGYEGYFSLDSQSAINQFVSDITSFIDEYGFDGIDIDLEQSSVNFDSGQDPNINEIKSTRLKNMVTAIRTIVHKYGDDFILSWAPETFYVQMGYTYYAGINQYCDARAGSYLLFMYSYTIQLQLRHRMVFHTTWERKKQRLQCVRCFLTDFM